MIFDDVLKKELLQLTDTERKLFITHTQKHYIAAGTYLLKKNILENKPLKYARCLKPNSRTNPATVKDVVNPAYYLPLDIHLHELADEWKLKCNYSQILKIPMHELRLFGIIISP